MDRIEIKKGIIEALENIGVFCDCEDDDIQLQEVILDSIMCITFIIELENIFGIEIPDKYLNRDQLSDYKAIENLIYSLLQSSNE